MAALTSILAAASIGAAAVGGALQYKSAKKQRNEQRAQIAAQKEAAREAAKLKTTSEDTGAKVKLGATSSARSTTGTSSDKGTAKRKTSSTVGGFGVSASRVGGL